MSDFDQRKYEYQMYYAYIGLRVHGHLERLFTFKEYWYGRRVERYSYPTNPRSGLQQGNRSVLKEGVYQWQYFSDGAKNFYNERAKRRKLYGYHVWLEQYLNANLPMIIYWGPLEQDDTHPTTIQEYGFAHWAGGASEAFPVGSVFLSVVATDPADLLGYGTWAAIAAGKMLVGLDSGDASFDVVEETGGEKTHTLTEAEIPSHTHSLRHRSSTSGSDNTFDTYAADASSTLAAAGITGTAGSGGAHNNLPPYFVVYMWKRTA